MGKTTKPGSAPGGGGVFSLTQGTQKDAEVKKEIAELDQLLARTTQTSQSTQLLKKRKEMKEVDDALELMKRDYKRRMDECEERRLQFELKQAKMREQVLKFEKFIQENDAKRLRAETKARQERKNYEDKCKEISSIMLEIDQLEKKQRDLLEELARRSCHREYLERIVEVGDDFEEVGDILKRHETLVNANDDLAARASEQDGEVEQLRIKVESLRMSAQNSLLVGTSQVQEKQEELEGHRLRVTQTELQMGQSLEKEKGVQRMSGEVIQAIKNIHNRCVSTMRNKIMFTPQNPTHLELLAFNLEVLATRIIDLMDITSDFNAGIDRSESLISGDEQLKEGSTTSLHSSSIATGTLLGSKSVPNL
jgi:hypothetical protein